MGALTWEDEELITRGASAGILDARLKMDGESNRDPFARVWPPSPNGSIAGNSLACLRYLARDPATAIRVESPRAYSLTLDRAVTAPNAVIGVAFGKPASSRSAWRFMFPGDTIFVPGGFTRYWIFNADNLDKLSGGLPAARARPLGYCGFLVGTRPNGAAPVQLAPLPEARIFHAANTSLTTEYFFGRGAMQRILVRAIAQDANLGSQSARFTIRFAPVSFVRGEASAVNYETESIDGLAQSAVFYRGHTVHLLGVEGGGGTIAQGHVTLSPAMIQSVLHLGHATWTGTIVQFLYQLEAAD